MSMKIFFYQNFKSQIPFLAASGFYHSQILEFKKQ